MGDNDSTLNINIRTTADAAALKSVQADLTAVTVVTREAAAAGQVLAVSQKAAGEAAEGAAHSRSTLRLAVRGANDAAWALTDLLSGNMIVAFHRMRGASEDLGIAFKSAFAPTAWIAGITLGMEILSHLVFNTDEAKKATEKHGEETEKTKAKLFDFNQALKEQSQTTAEALRPQLGYTQALADFTKQLDSIHDGPDQLKSAFDAVDKINEQITKAAEARKKQIDEELKGTNTLIDSETQLAKAIIGRRKASGEVFGDDAVLQEAAVEKKGSLEKLENERKAIMDKDAEDRDAVATQWKAAEEARRKAANTGRALAEARPDVMALVEQADALKVPHEKLQSGADFRALADALLAEWHRIEGASGGGGQEDQEIDEANMEKLRHFAQLLDMAPGREGLARQQEAKAASAEAGYERGLAAKDRQLLENKNKVGAAEAQFDTTTGEVHKRQQKEKWELDKKNFEAWIKSHPQSADEAHAAALDLAKRNRPNSQRTDEEIGRNNLYVARNSNQAELDKLKQALIRAGAPNAPAMAGQIEAEKAAEKQRDFSQLPPQQQIIEEAKQVASTSPRSNSTATGSVVAALQEQIRKLEQNPTDKDNALVIELVRQLISAQNAMHTNTAGNEAELKRMKAEVDQLNSQIRHMGR